MEWSGCLRVSGSELSARVISLGSAHAAAAVASRCSARARCDTDLEHVYCSILSRVTQLNADVTE